MKNDPEDKMFKTPSRDSEEMFQVAREFGQALIQDNLRVTYSQIEGVIVFLPEQGNVHLTHQDFERLHDMFTEETYGPVFDRIRDREDGLRNQSDYDSIIREALKSYFPSFDQS